MQLHIMKNNNTEGNRNRASLLINYIIGRTKEHAEALDNQLDFITSSGFDLIDPTFGGSIPLRDADFSLHIREIEEMIELNAAVDNPLKHFIVSLPCNEHLEHWQWAEAAHELMQKMGYEHCKYIVIRHNDTDNEHVHIAACSVQDVPNNPVVNQWQEKVKGMKIMRELETKLALTAEHGPEDGNAINNAHRQPSKARVRRIIDLIIAKKPSQPLPELIRRLNHYGVGVSIQFKEGKAVGLSYSLDDMNCSGRKLGGAGRYALPGLIRSGIVYDAVNDHDELEVLNKEEQQRKDGKAPKLSISKLAEHTYNNHVKVGDTLTPNTYPFYIVVRVKREHISRVKRIRTLPRFIRYNNHTALLYFSCNGKADKEMLKAMIELVKAILKVLFGEVDAYLETVKESIDLKEFKTLKLSQSKTIEITDDYENDIKDAIKVNNTTKVKFNRESTQSCYET